jgi:hypothetical protein
MAEAIPTRPPAPPSSPKPSRPIRPWTPEEQAQHWTDLGNALDGWVWDEERRDKERRHLRAVTDTAA